MKNKPFRWLATKWYGWVALAVLTILIAWLAAPEWIEAGGYSITRAILELGNYSPTGTWDHSGGILKLEAGACPPASTGCDAGDGSEEKRIFVCTSGGNTIYACNDDSTGWVDVGTTFDVTANYVVTGEMDFLNGSLRNPGGNCIGNVPPAIDCDEDGEERTFWMCDGSPDDIFICAESTAGWEKLANEQNGFSPSGVWMPSGNWIPSAGNWDLTSATTVKIDQLDDPGSDLEIAFNNASIRAMDVTNQDADYESIIKTDGHFAEARSGTQFPLVTRNELGNALSGRPLVTLRFDDGGESQYDNLFPLVKQYRIPVTLYINTDTIDGVGKLTTAQIQEMENSGLVEIGTHSDTHVSWTGLTDAQIATEITNTASWFDTNLGHQPTAFVFPFGDRDEHTTAIALSVYQNLSDTGIDYHRFGSPNRAQMGCFSMDGELGDDINDPVEVAKGDGVSSMWGVCYLAHNVDVGSGACVGACVYQDEVETFFTYLRGEIDEGNIDVVTMSEFANRMEVRKPYSNEVFNPKFVETTAISGNPTWPGWPDEDTTGCTTTTYANDLMTKSNIGCGDSTANATHKYFNGLIPNAEYRFSFKQIVRGDDGSGPEPCIGGTTGTRMRIDELSEANLLIYVGSRQTVVGTYYDTGVFRPTGTNIQIKFDHTGGDCVVDYEQPLVMLMSQRRNADPTSGAGGFRPVNLWENTPARFTYNSTLSVAASSTGTLDVDIFNTNARSSITSNGNQFLIIKVQVGAGSSTDYDIAFYGNDAATGTLFHTLSTFTTAAEIRGNVFFIRDEKYPGTITNEHLHIEITNNDGVNAVDSILTVEGFLMGVSQ